LSTFDVTSFYTKTSDTYGDLSSYLLTGTDILTYTKPYSESTYVDKMIYATQNRIVDQQSKRSVSGALITAFKPMVTPDSNAAFAAIDSGKLKVFTRQLTVAGRQLAASDFTDTQHLIVALSDGKIMYAQKSDLYDDYIEMPAEFSSIPEYIESDGHNVYFLVSGVMSSAVEVLSLV